MAKHNPLTRYRIRRPDPFRIIYVETVHSVDGVVVKATWTHSPKKAITLPREEALAVAIRLEEIESLRLALVGVSLLPPQLAVVPTTGGTGIWR